RTPVCQSVGMKAIVAMLAGSVGPGGYITHLTPPASVAWASVLVVALLGGRQVEGGIAVEETVGPELEPDRGDRHHRPVLRPDHVVRGERVPEHQVGVLQRAVRRGPGRQAVPAGVLVGVVAGREPLAGVVRGD